MTAVALCNAYKSEKIARRAECERCALRAKSLHFRRFPTSFPQSYNFIPLILSASDCRAIDRDPSRFPVTDGCLCTRSVSSYMHDLARKEGHIVICIKTRGLKICAQDRISLVARKGRRVLFFSFLACFLHAALIFFFAIITL